MSKVTPGKKTAAKGGKPPVAARQQGTPQKQLPAPEGAGAIAKIDDILLADIGSGMEGMTRDSFAIPRIVILQGLSPASTKGGPGYVEGAEVGMIMENVSQQLWDGETGLLFVPISYRFTHLHWWPRNSTKGKGFIADLGEDPKALLGTTRGPKGENMKADGSEVVPTAEYFGFIVDEDTHDVAPVLLSMSKSQMKKSKRLNTLTQIIIKVGTTQGKAALFSRAYRLTTVAETNGANQTFMNWNVEPGPVLVDAIKEFITPTPEVLENGYDIYMAARAFKTSVDKGEVKATAPAQDDHVPDANAAGAGNDSPM